MNPQEFLSNITFTNGLSSPCLCVLVVGIFYGMTLCSFSCLPYIGTYIMGTQVGGCQGLRATFVFCLARMVTYTFLGGLCGYLGRVIPDAINTEVIFFMTAAIIFLIGVHIILKPLTLCHRSNLSKKMPMQKSYIHLVAMGTVVSLVPCLPLTAVLLYSSTMQSVFSGALMALMFGIGTSISPLYFFGGALGLVSKKIRTHIPQHRFLLQRISGMILIFLGARLLCVALDV